MKAILKLGRYFYVGINFLIFKFFGVDYEQFPVTNGKISLRGRGKLKMGKGVIITSSYAANPVGISFKTAFYISRKARVNIGNNVGISNSLIFATHKITIEDDVLIGGGSQLLDSDFHPISAKQRINKENQHTIAKAIHIKRGVFVGAGSMILKGVTIGENSIIGAMSLVTRDIPANEIWGGNPAKFIKKLESE